MNHWHCKMRPLLFRIFQILSGFVTLKVLVCIPDIILNLEFTFYGKWCHNYLRSCWREAHRIIINLCLLRTWKFSLHATLFLAQKGGERRRIQTTRHNTTVKESAFVECIWWHVYFWCTVPSEALSGTTRLQQRTKDQSHSCLQNPRRSFS